jgi:hypothetical protein
MWTNKRKKVSNKDNKKGMKKGQKNKIKTERRKK